MIVVKPEMSVIVPYGADTPDTHFYCNSPGVYTKLYYMVGVLLWISSIDESLARRLLKLLQTFLYSLA